MGNWKGGGDVFHGTYAEKGLLFLKPTTPFPPSSSRRKKDFSQKESVCMHTRVGKAWTEGKKGGSLQERVQKTSDVKRGEGRGVDLNCPEVCKNV